MSDQPTPETEPRDTLGQAFNEYAQRAGLRRDDRGQLDVMHAMGGWRGLLEALLPGFVYLCAYLLSQQLTVALIASLATAAVFTVARLAQRQPLTQALSGLAGVAVCALFARAGGQALDYYVPGFITNAVALAVLGSTSAIGWPLLGVFYGYVRGEGTQWRADRVRRGVYHRATLVLIAMFAARLLVQVPLYFAGNVAALGVMRLLMGVPLYASVLWIAWLMTRPAARPR